MTTVTLLLLQASAMALRPNSVPAPKGKLCSAEWLVLRDERTYVNNGGVRRQLRGEVRQQLRHKL